MAFEQPPDRSTQLPRSVPMDDPDLTLLLQERPVEVFLYSVTCLVNRAPDEVEVGKRPSDVSACTVTPPLGADT